MSEISICFDLDGTLVDSAADIVARLNDALFHNGLPPVSPELGRSFIGTGSRDLITRAVQANNVEADAILLERLYEDYFSIYSDRVCEQTYVYPNVTEALSGLQALGHTLSVCTNKPGTIARPLLKQLGLLHYFERVIGAQDGFPVKPAPDMIFAAAGHSDANHILMIGDSGTDARAAKAAGVGCLLVNYGYCQEPIEGLVSDGIISSLSEIALCLGSA